MWFPAHKLAACSFRLPDQLVKGLGVNAVGGRPGEVSSVRNIENDPGNLLLSLSRPFRILFLNPILSPHHDVNVADHAITLAITLCKYRLKCDGRTVRKRVPYLQNVLGGSFWVCEDVAHCRVIPLQYGAVPLYKLVVVVLGRGGNIDSWFSRSGHDC